MYSFGRYFIQVHGYVKKNHVVRFELTIEIALFCLFNKHLVSAQRPYSKTQGHTAWSILLGSMLCVPRLGEIWRHRLQSWTCSWKALDEEETGRTRPTHPAWKNWGLPRRGGDVWVKMWRWRGHMEKKVPETSRNFQKENTAGGRLWRWESTDQTPIVRGCRWFVRNAYTAPVGIQTHRLFQNWLKFAI